MAWKQKQKRLSTIFQSKNKCRYRQGFRYQSKKIDPISKQTYLYYPHLKRIATIALITLPCIIASIILVTALIAVNLAIEVYFCHYYTGPFKSLVSLLPSVTYAASIPTMVNFYTKAMKRLNELENRVTTRNHDDALTFKGFTVSIIVVFLNLFLVGFLLIPFRDHIDGFFLSEKLTVNMFVDRVKYFVVTGQVFDL